MNKKALLLTGVVIIASFFIFQAQVSKYGKWNQLENTEQKREDFAARDRQLFLMLRDPAANQIPKNIYTNG